MRRWKKKREEQRRGRKGGIKAWGQGIGKSGIPYAFAIKNTELTNI